MEEIVVRLASEKDLPAICRLVGQLSPHAHDYRNAVENFYRKIDKNPDYFLMVATYGFGGNVVGTAMMHFQHKLSYHCGTAAHLEDVVVDEAYRGKGIGDALVKRAIETAKSFKCYKIMLTCYEKTASYYERFGFIKHDIGMRLELKELYPSGG